LAAVAVMQFNRSCVVLVCCKSCCPRVLHSVYMGLVTQLYCGMWTHIV